MPPPRSPQRTLRAADLRVSDLLDVAEQGGTLRFAGERVLLLDAVALGLLRKELVGLVGLAGARALMTRFGFSHGWRTAEALEAALPWAEPAEWRGAGGRLHRLQGLVTFEPVDPARAEPGAFAQAVWRDSYEAEQHVLHLGRSDEPVCWSLTGFASGYLSRANSRRILCVERTCVARGDAVCSMVARAVEDWPEEERARIQPWYEADCLEDALRAVQRSLRRAERSLRLARAANGDAPWPGLVARSERMQRVVDAARRLAAVDTSVLVTGESGVGKERIARLLHDASPRVARPFLAINCAAVPETLLEDELFGHARGAFTGAGAIRLGLFEAANGGTLLLDEVGEIPPRMQAKLLRVLQEREIKRLGENEPRKIDVRVVASTHRDLAAMVEAGTFRQDLLYRLRVVELRVPALRERPEDIVPLAKHFLAEVASRLGLAPKQLGPATCRAMLAHDWPGNARELQNAMERAAVLAPGATIRPQDLPDELQDGRVGARRGEVRTLAELEREAILAAVRVSRSREEAARRLGISPATLYRRLESYVDAPPRAPGRRRRP